MALKGDRSYGHGADTDISYFMNMTSERGAIVVHNSSGSGAAMDQADANVAVPTGGVSGTKPAGLLLCDVVNLDLTRQHLNQHKDEVQIGGKVALLRRGVALTNFITAGQTPTAGNDAYYDSDGKLRTSDPGNSTKVGKFLSKKDADGYAKVEINIV